MDEIRKNGFIVYCDLLDTVEPLSMEQLGILFKAILCDQSGKELPDMDAAVKIAFSFVKKSIDFNTRKYSRIVERRREAGKKGGDAKANNSREKQNVANDSKEVANCSKTKQNVANDSKELANDGDNREQITENSKQISDNGYQITENSKQITEINNKERETAKAVTRTHKEKHHHGAFKNVLLTDEEMDALVKEFSRERTEEAIAFFDAYIEEKGYKSKSHYLSIRRWVMKALDERDQKAAGAPPDTGGGRKKTKAEQEMDAWMQMLRETVEEEQNGGDQGNGEASTLPFL